MPKAQDKFLQALIEALGDKSFVDRHPGIKIKPDYRLNAFTDSRLNEAFAYILEELGSTYDFSNRSLPVDACIVNHPKFKTRIVEFDEAQHFTLHRRKTIEVIKDILPLHFQKSYLELFLQPETIQAMESTTQGRQGFNRPACGFSFPGGRACQRAYYNTLKDCAHMSLHNPRLSPILRFNIFEFELVAKQAFLDIPQDTLIALITAKLKKLN